MECPCCVTRYAAVHSARRSRLRQLLRVEAPLRRQPPVYCRGEEGGYYALGRTLLWKNQISGRDRAYIGASAQ